MIAFGQAAANLRKIKEQSQQPENIDALTVLETQTNLGAVSAKNAQDAGEKAVKVPAPEMTITFGPDGEELLSSRNIPLTSPTKQVREAQAKPYQRFADTLQATLDQSSQLAEGAPDPTNVGDDPAALAHELGVDKPGFGEGGLLPWASKADKYDRLLKDLPRLKQLVASKRLKDKMDLLGQGAEAYRAVKGIEGDERAADKEKRSEAITRETMLQHMLTRDPLGYGSADKYLETIGATMKNVFGEEMTGADQARALNEYSTALRKRDLEELKIERDKEKDEKTAKALDLRIETLERELENPQWNNQSRERRIPRSKSYLDRLSPETLGSFIGDPEVDQDSAWEAVDIALEQWQQEGEKNSSEYDQNLAKINAGVTGGMKKADVDALKERNKYLQRRNRYLIDKTKTLRDRVDSQRESGPTLTAPTTPALGAPGATKKKDSLGVL